MRTKYTTLPVNVTKRCIKEGVVIDCEHCPVSIAVANAVHKRFRRYTSINVSTSYSEIRVSANTVAGKTMDLVMVQIPEKVKAFIAAFDCNDDVKPFTFVFKGL